MLILEGGCPKCFGNLVLNEKEMSLTCEDGCSYQEVTKDKRAFVAAMEEAEEWGPKEKRLGPSPVGNLLHQAYKAGNMVYLRYLMETLDEAIKGLELEDYDLGALKRYRLIEEEEKCQEEIH